MERAKSGYQWRGYSPARAIDELKRLSTFTDLGHWVINIADPLFGFQRAWRREVLEGIIENNLLPRQYWTLTRSDDLTDVDVSLLAKARFSIGIGVESGSPTMLSLMQKGNQPSRYLAAMLRLAKLSRKHGLNWASNIIVGHPGETPETMRETHAYLTELFTSGKETCGWLSIDPFRLYPGAEVFEEMPKYEETYGSHFYHKEWWKSWYDASFCAQHLDPSRELSYAERVHFMFDAYAPLVQQVQSRFRGQGRSIDRVFARSLDDQAKLLSPRHREQMLIQGKRAQGDKQSKSLPLAIPIGLHVRDPWIRRREEAVRRLLDNGVLRTTDLVEALLQVGPEAFMDPAAARATMADQIKLDEEGLIPSGLAISTLAKGIEAMEPAPGDHIVDFTAKTGYLAAILAHLVGESGKILAIHRGNADALRWSVANFPQIQVQTANSGSRFAIDGLWDGMWIGGTLPRFPPSLVSKLRKPGGRAIVGLGPRFRPQDFVSVTQTETGFTERIFDRLSLPIIRDPLGWLTRPQEKPTSSTSIRSDTTNAAALAFWVLAHLPLGRDAASMYDPTLPERPWVKPLLSAYQAAPGRLDLHRLPLAVDSVPDLIGLLRRKPPVRLSDPTGKHLAETFASALESEVNDYPAPEPIALKPTTQAQLAAFREAMYLPRGEHAPPLRILHCPALKRHGRATKVGKHRVVAVSLTEPEEHVLFQIWHEEMHAVTDPLVLAEKATTSRDTRLGQPGFELHRELELVAIGATQAVLESQFSEYLPAFHRWCKTSGHPVDVPST